MKFIHTADWQLGAKLSHAGEKAPELRKKRFEAAEKVVEVVEEEEPEFLLIAGDLFEDHNVSDRVVHRAVRILNRMAPLPVYVLPGNHDLIRPGSVWDRSSWTATEEHVHLLTEAEPVEPVEGVALFPCPIAQKKSTQDPTEAIPDRADDDRIRIGIAHGGLTDAADQPNFPIDPGRAEKSGLDYLALGDWHGTSIRDRTAYSGTIEQSAFDESDSGNVLMVELEDSGKPPEIERCRVGQLRWMAREIEVDDVSDIEALEEELEAEGDPSELVLRLSVQILETATAEVLDRLDQLRHRLEDEAFHLEWHEDDSVYLSQREVAIPEGVLTRADEILSEVLEGNIPDGVGRQVADEPPDKVHEARTLLRREARKEQA